MRIPATSKPLTVLRMKNCLEDQGRAISATVATLGEPSVAWAMSVRGSGAGEGTSICGCGSADLESTWRGRSAQRAPRKATTSTAISPMTSLREGLLLGGGGSGTVTPGICGISVLKRSDGGWSGISLICSLTLYWKRMAYSKRKTVPKCGRGSGTAWTAKNV